MLCLKSKKASLDQNYKQCFSREMKQVHIIFFFFLTLSSNAQVNFERKSEIGKTNCFIEIKGTKDPVRRSIGSDQEIKLVGVDVEINNRKGESGIAINPLFFEVADKNGNNLSWATPNLLNGLKSPERNIGKRKTTRGWIVFQLPSKTKLKGLIIRYNKSRFQNNPNDQSGWIEVR